MVARHAEHADNYPSNSVNLLMQIFDRITSNPEILHGQPTIRGMRLSVRRVVEAVAIYPDRNELFRQYPELEPEDVRQALEFAARCIDDQILAA